MLFCKESSLLSLEVSFPRSELLFHCSLFALKFANFLLQLEHFHFIKFCIFISFVALLIFFLPVFDLHFLFKGLFFDSMHFLCDPIKICFHSIDVAFHLLYFGEEAVWFDGDGTVFHFYFFEFSIELYVFMLEAGEFRWRVRMLNFWPHSLKLFSFEL